MSDPSYLTILGFGLLLGLRHALDADHLAAVSTVLAERPSVTASGVVGLWWGIGHTVSLLMVGAVVLALGLRIPDSFAAVAEGGVAVLLILLGGSLAFRLSQERWHVHSHHHAGDRHLHLHSHLHHDDHGHEHWAARSARPLCIGMAHGLAGSAALMLLIVSTTQGFAQGIAYIAVFGLGSILGMTMIGLTISLPVVCSRAVGRRTFVAVQGLASAASLCLGLWMLVKLAS
jgi:sulfite exporter TauE/SafE